MISRRAGLLLVCLLLPACATTQSRAKIGYAIEDSLLAVLLTEAPLVGYRECLLSEGEPELDLKNGAINASYWLTFEFADEGPKLTEFEVNLGTPSLKLETSSRKCTAFVLNIKAGEYPAAVNHASAAAWSALPGSLQKKLPSPANSADATFARLKGRSIFARGTLFPKTNAQIWDSTDQLHMNMGDVILRGGRP